MLECSDRPLAIGYDVAMLDLDGVIYVGGSAVPRAPEALAEAREAGMRLAFITNNASRPPETVAEHLVSLGVPATRDDVVTSAQAAARVLVDRLGHGARVAVLGAEGLLEAIGAAGLSPVGVEDDAEAIVTGYGPQVRWQDIMRACVRVRDGLWWVASNTDLTIPTAYGTAPGHGVLVDTVRRFSGVEPVVAGKPARPLLDETVRRVGGRRPLMVGDRLDTDIAGAHHAGVDSLLVLTGVTGVGEIASASADLRPTYISPDLDGLMEPQPIPTLDDTTAALGGWRARVRGGRLLIEGGGGAADWWRVLAAAAWAHLDSTGSPAEVDGLAAPRSSSRSAGPAGR